MKSVRTMVLAGLVAGCEMPATVDPADSESLAGSGSGSEGNFCNVISMPPAPFYVLGQPLPVAGPDTGWVVFKDWTAQPAIVVANHPPPVSLTVWMVALADLRQGRVTFAVRARQLVLPAIFSILGTTERLVVPKPPPPPPPPGDEGLARFILEVQLRVNNVGTIAGNLAKSCPESSAL